MTDSPSIVTDSMHQSAALINSLAIALKQQLQGYYLHDVYADSAAQITLVFKKQNQIFNIHHIISNRDLLFSFSQLERARPSGSRLMFKEAMGLQVQDLLCQKGERFIVIQLDIDLKICLKYFGSMANVLLYRNNKVIELFRTTIVSDLSFVIPENISPVNVEGPPNTFELYGSKQEGWKILFRENVRLNSISDYNLFEVLNDFTNQVLGARNLESERNSVLAFLRNKEKRVTKLIHQTKMALEVIKNQPSGEETGHIIMASLHLIKKGDEMLLADDFYNGSQREIKLNPEKSALENAEIFYRKAKSVKTEIERLSQQLEKNLIILQSTQDDLQKVAMVDSIKMLKPWLKQDSAIQKVTPYHIYEKDGYEILVGKNAKYNDALTFHIASKFDIFLHAQGVAGSHVIIRNRGRDLPPDRVIVRAAELAAWFSKSKGSQLVPVIYAFRKHVRKPKGSAPGLVIVTNETGIMVEPRN